MDLRGTDIPCRAGCVCPGFCKLHLAVSQPDRVARHRVHPAESPGLPHRTRVPEGQKAPREQRCAGPQRPFYFRNDVCRSTCSRRIWTQEGGKNEGRD